MFAQSEIRVPQKKTTGLRHKSSLRETLIQVFPTRLFLLLFFLAWATVSAFFFWIFAELVSLFESAIISLSLYSTSKAYLLNPETRYLKYFFQMTTIAFLKNFLNRVSDLLTINAIHIRKQVNLLIAIPSWSQSILFRQFWNFLKVRRSEFFQSCLRSSLVGSKQRLLVSCLRRSTQS